MAGNPTLPTENIDEVILRLLALEPNEIEELDYDKYKGSLRELLVEIDRGRKIGGDEAESIRNEFKRVRGKKGRFRIKKTKISASGLGLGGIRKQIKGTQQRLLLSPAGGISPQVQQDTQKNSLSKINEILGSILSKLLDLNRQTQEENERKRLDDEKNKRGERESSLESKTFQAFKKAIDIVTKPFQSIFDKIINFIFYTLLGKVVIKLIDWFANPENQKKIQSLVRFFKDHWPTLLALYLRFGTGIGRFVGGLSRFLIKGAIKLGAITAQLAVKAGLGRAGGKLAKVASFLGGPRGKLLGSALAIGTDVAMTIGASKAAEGLASGDLKVPGFSGGGWNKGFNSIGKFFGGVGNFFGNMFSGLVKGPKGRDKVPAMLSDGEFVMSVGAVKKHGVDTLEAMNAAGGGTNVPQIANGMTYAEGGGYISGSDKPSDPATRRNESLLQKQKKEENNLGSSFKWNANRDIIASKGGKLGIMSKGDSSSWREPSYSEKGQIPISNMNAFARSAAGLRFIQQRDAMRSGIPDLGIPVSATTPRIVPTSPRYTPYQSRFAGARDAAFSRAQGITGDPGSGSNPYNPMNWFKMGGVFGGPRMQARTDYAASKGKYYSSSDQKTYGNYNDAKAARQSRLTSLASQQRLNRLSSQGAGPRTGRGIRYTTEAKAQVGEDIKRGGTWGQITRGLTRMFSDPNSKLGRERISKLDAEDRASQARVKQAGAASIGRYYSSSDGKYYKNYAAAKLAHEQRKKSGVKPLPKPKPKPKNNPAGGGMNGARGSGNTQKAPSPSPRHRAGTRTTERTAGVIKR